MEALLFNLGLEGIPEGLHRRTRVALTTTLAIRKVIGKTLSLVALF